MGSTTSSSSFKNHSFDNLYGLWDEVNGHHINGLPHADAPQVQADGETPYTCLLQNDINLTSPSPLPANCSERYDGVAFRSAFVNAPFKIEDYISATDTTCPGTDVSAPNGIAKGSATSILKLIEERFHLDPLGSRDKTVESLNTAIEAAEAN